MATDAEMEAMLDKRSLGEKLTYEQMKVYQLARDRLVKIELERRRPAAEARRSSLASVQSLEAQASPLGLAKKSNGIDRAELWRRAHEKAVAMPPLRD